MNELLIESREETTVVSETAVDSPSRVPDPTERPGGGAIVATGGSNANLPTPHCVATFLQNVLKHDLDFKVRNLPMRLQKDAAQLSAGFRTELLSLVTEAAREAT